MTTPTHNSNNWMNEEPSLASLVRPLRAELSETPEGWCVEISSLTPCDAMMALTRDDLLETSTILSGGGEAQWVACVHGPVELGDAKAIVHNSMEPLDQKLKTNLMICHPPYFNVYKYSSIFKFEMLWTGFSPKLIRPKELRESFKIGKEERVHLYVEDLVKAVNNSANTVAIGGRFVLMMGDTTLREERINTTSLFIKALEVSKSDFEIEEFIIRVPKHTEASYAAGQRRDGDQVGVKLQDHILILKRSRG